MPSRKPTAAARKAVTHDAKVTLYPNSPTIKIVLQKKAAAKRAAPAPATIKPAAKKMVSNAMGGLAQPRTQGPKRRQSVDGRIGAEAAAQARAQRPKPKTKARRP